MKRLLLLGEKLSKTQQGEIIGGHQGGPSCSSNCRTKRNQAIKECEQDISFPAFSNCLERARIDYLCCIDTCAPDGGQVR